MEGSGVVGFGSFDFDGEGDGDEEGEGDMEEDSDIEGTGVFRLWPSDGEGEAVVSIWASDCMGDGEGVVKIGASDCMGEGEGVVGFCDSVGEGEGLVSLSCLSDQWTEGIAVEMVRKRAKRAKVRGVRIERRIVLVWFLHTGMGAIEPRR